MRAQACPSSLSCLVPQVKALHAGHDVASIRALLPRLHYFDDGTCIVHHMFGAEVTQHVRQAYPDAFLTAHFEVRGATARASAQWALRPLFAPAGGSAPHHRPPGASPTQRRPCSAFWCCTGWRTVVSRSLLYLHCGLYQSAPC